MTLFRYLCAVKTKVNALPVHHTAMARIPYGRN